MSFTVSDLREFMRHLTRFLPPQGEHGHHSLTYFETTANPNKRLVLKIAGRPVDVHFEEGDFGMSPRKLARLIAAQVLTGSDSLREDARRDAGPRMLDDPEVERARRL